MIGSQDPAMELNTVTPRVFVAATRQDDGKTTTSLGLLGVLRQRLGRIGYIKPVGQRTVDIGGLKIDEDSVLINDTYNPGLPLEAMSPIAVEGDFTRKYLDHPDPAPLEEKVVAAFNRAAWEQQFVIIEGTGHAGVGSVFDMSNARVAQLLRSRVIIVSQGGVGKPLDEIALNLSLFRERGVEVLGVVLNKVIPDKIEKLRPYAEKGLSRMGLNLLGIIPLSQELRKPTINQVRQELGGEWVSGAKYHRRRVNRVFIGAASSRHAELYFEPDSLIITSGDREDLILAILAACGDGSAVRLAGVVLTQGLMPQSGLLKVMQGKNIPFICVKQDSYTAATMINSMTVKTEPGDSQKIGLIQDLINTHVSVERIIEHGRVSA
ncbi:MAG: AAA family ATPase [Candidatus Methylacidiphilales bacterium]|nr:AAA family ATPase [Candidatus Methylacidiphilales bacterium]